VRAARPMATFTVHTGCAVLRHKLFMCIALVFIAVIFIDVL
jgi:hypothetical protein